MDWELERIRAYLSPEALARMTEPLEDRELADGSRQFIDGVGTVAAIVPAMGAPAMTVLSLAAAFMTGNFTFLSVPLEAAATTMLVVETFDAVLRERQVNALSAVVPDGPRELLGILSESPRVDALLSFSQGDAELDAHAQANALGKAVVSAWDTGDVALVWDTAHVGEAARTIVAGRFTDTGRLPASLQRVLVPRDSTEDLVSALEKEIHSLRVGLPSDPATDVGPVGRLGTLEHLQEVVDEARELGAEVVHGGERINWRGEADPLGNYFQPTLVAGCNAGMRIANERIVGPVLPVVPLDNETDVPSMTCKPLRPCRVWLWATSRADRDRLVERLRAPVIVFSGRMSQGLGGGLDLSDAWGALELSERLSYRSWRGPMGQ
jgi:acyl-CoA reductase-like NAD-dependent aldehyde dehydrogenase